MKIIVIATTVLWAFIGIMITMFITGCGDSQKITTNNTVCNQYITVEMTPEEYEQKLASGEAEEDGLTNVRYEERSSGTVVTADICRSNSNNSAIVEGEINL